MIIAFLDQTNDTARHGFRPVSQPSLWDSSAPADTPRGVLHHFHDYVPQRMELSVSDGSVKVYSETLVEPPEGIPDCSAYPERDKDRYVCLYQREMMPSAPPRDDTVLDALPDKLVQPKENYELVFAEEFDGTSIQRPTGFCEGGLSDLGGDQWNFRDGWCESVDAAEVSCQNMRDGHYEMSYTYQCGSGIDTRGKFTYKYGYLETEYTVNLDDSFPQNMAFVMGEPRRSLKYTVERYDVPIGNYEEMSKFLPIEINLYEYFPERKRELTNWFYNYHPYVRYPHTEPRYASNWTRFCDDAGQGIRQLNFLALPG